MIPFFCETQQGNIDFIKGEVCIFVRRSEVYDADANLRIS